MTLSEFLPCLASNTAMKISIYDAEDNKLLVFYAPGHDYLDDELMEAVVDTVQVLGRNDIKIKTVESFTPAEEPEGE